VRSKQLDDGVNEMFYSLQG